MTRIPASGAGKEDDDMRARPVRWIVLVLLAAWLSTPSAPESAARRNIIIFVADGLRHDSVTATETPALWHVRTQGVHFSESHSVFPTFTMANASVIATGHHLGDTGNFSNTIWAGFASFDTGNFKLPLSTPVPFIESDTVLADLNSHYEGNFLGEVTLLGLARANGYQTAAIGKVGPTAIQDVTVLAPVNGEFATPPASVIIDDATGTAAGVPLPAWLITRLGAAGLPPEAPLRTNGFAATSRYGNGFAGDRTQAGTLAANVVQQDWMSAVATQAVLPAFADAKRPFALMFWSRDPDGSQHNEGDSLGDLSTGINGPTGRAGVRNADRNLQRILDWLNAHPAVKANTNIIVTSDHGFATISRSVINAAGRVTAAPSAQHDYQDATGKIESVKGTLPKGFLAIDLALGLRLSLDDPDTRPAVGSAYRRLRLSGPDPWDRPARGNGLIGPDTMARADGGDARVIVAANGGSDLIYVPDRNAGTVRQVVSLLLALDYVDGVFVDDQFGEIPGTLPLSAIDLVGSSRVPRPAIIVAFASFRQRTGDWLSAVQVSDTDLQHGQGMHGGFGRDSTFNNMAAIGPDFKKRFVALTPVSNADITPTIAHVLGLAMPRNGRLVGRAALEALKNGPKVLQPPFKYLRSAPVGGRQTVVVYREVDGVRYLYAGCLAPVAVIDAEACR